VNDVTEMPGVDVEAAVEEVDELLALDALELVLLEELPHPVATADTAKPNAHTRNTRAFIPARSSQDAQLTQQNQIFCRVFGPGPNLQWQTARLPSTHINAP
jgi:hypothetical protein